MYFLGKEMLHFPKIWHLTRQAPYLIKRYTGRKVIRAINVSLCE